MHFSTSSLHLIRIYLRVLTLCVCMAGTRCGCTEAQSSSVLCCGAGWELKAKEGGAGTGGTLGMGYEWCQRAPELWGTPQIPAAQAWLQAASECQAFPAFLEKFQPAWEEEVVKCQENAKNNV